MKANINNLVKAVKLSAKAKHNEFKDWIDTDYQIAVKSTSPATIFDLRGIVLAFSIRTANAVEDSWGYTTIFLDEIEFRDKVDVEMLKAYLPYGWVENETWE